MTTFNFLASLINGNDPLVGFHARPSPFNFLASLINGNHCSGVEDHEDEELLTS